MADSTISSPCVSICEVEHGRCIGCGRSETEISEWRSYTEEKRLVIMDRLEQEAANGGWFAADAFDAAPAAASASPAAPAASATAGAAPTVASATPTPETKPGA